MRGGRKSKVFKRGRRTGATGGEASKGKENMSLRGMGPGGTEKGDVRKQGAEWLIT